jgi:transcription termination factor Rho
VTDTQEQTLPAATESSAQTTGAENGAAGRASASRPAAKRGSLSSMLLPELQQIAGGLGIRTTKMKKSDLVAAIQTARAGESGANGAAKTAKAEAPAAVPAASEASTTEAPREQRPRRERAPRGDRAAEPGNANQSGQASQGTQPSQSSQDTQDTGRQSDQGGQSSQAGTQDTNRQSDGGQNNQGGNRQRNQNNQGGGNQGGQNRQQGQGNQGQGNQGGGNQGGGNQGGQNRQQGQNNDDDDDFDGGRRRGRRYRDRRGRNRERTAGGGGQGGNDAEPTVTEDDVLVPVAGVVDAIEEKNAWFVRVGGFFATDEDVFVATSLVRRYGLRRGDAITGAVRQPREGERREKYNPLVRLDTVNGGDPELIKNRIEFTKLTPLYPQERLRLETEPHILTTRVIDLVMPIGKGQRALVVSPPKAGKTMVLQSIANAIATNNPECHLMVVLVDERPEEVTDMQRSVKGEVIASTFDRRPHDHTMVAELSIERAKRLVEMGHDVVVLLDSITRLGRAYNLAAPASGRILSGGVDSTALYPPKRFLGAARNIENGGSLTIIATALVETGSAGDTVIFEEFKGTGNAELKLDRKIADKRVFPAIDVDQSSTRKEELLLSPDELAVTIKLRRVLHALEPQQAIELLLDRLRKTHTNIEFLMQIAKTTPGQD